MFLDLNYAKSVASGGRRGSASINIICLRGEQHVHVQAVAVVECCCSNSTLETDSAEPLWAAAALLGSAFNKNQK